MCMGTKTFNLSLPAELVALIDNEAKLNYETRSEYIKRATLQRLKADGIDINATPQNRAPADMQRERLKAFLAEYQRDADLDLDSEWEDLE